MFNGGEPPVGMGNARVSGRTCGPIDGEYSTLPESSGIAPEPGFTPASPDPLAALESETVSFGSMHLLRDAAAVRWLTGNEPFPESSEIGVTDFLNTRFVDLGINFVACETEVTHTELYEALHAVNFPPSAQMFLLVITKNTDNSLNLQRIPVPNLNARVERSVSTLDGNRESVYYHVFEGDGYRDSFGFGANGELIPQTPHQILGLRDGEWISEVTSDVVRVSRRNGGGKIVSENISGIPLLADIARQYNRGMESFVDDLVADSEARQAAVEEAVRRVGLERVSRILGVDALRVADVPREGLLALVRTIPNLDEFEVLPSPQSVIMPGSDSVRDLAGNSNDVVPQEYHTLVGAKLQEIGARYVSFELETPLTGNEVFLLNGYLLILAADENAYPSLAIITRGPDGELRFLPVGLVNVTRIERSVSEGGVSYTLTYDNGVVSPISLSQDGTRITAWDGSGTEIRDITVEIEALRAAAEAGASEPINNPQVDAAFRIQHHLREGEYLANERIVFEDGRMFTVVDVIDENRNCLRELYVGETGEIFVRRAEFDSFQGIDEWEVNTRSGRRDVGTGGRNGFARVSTNSPREAVPPGGTPEVRGVGGDGAAVAEPPGLRLPTWSEVVSGFRSTWRGSWLSRWLPSMETINRIAPGQRVMTAAMLSHTIMDQTIGGERADPLLRSIVGQLNTLMLAGATHIGELGGLEGIERATLAGFGQSLANLYGMSLAFIPNSMVNDEVIRTFERDSGIELTPLTRVTAGAAMALGAAMIADYFAPAIVTFLGAGETASFTIAGATVTIPVGTTAGIIIVSGVMALLLAAYEMLRETVGFLERNPEVAERLDGYLIEEYRLPENFSLLGTASQLEGEVAVAREELEAHAQ